MKISIKFYLDNPNAKISSSILFRAMVDKLPYRLSCGVSIIPKYWDKKNSKAIAGSPNYMLINSRIKDVAKFIESTAYTLENNKTFTHDEFRKILYKEFKTKLAKEKDKPAIEKTFYDHWNEFISFIEKNQKVVPRVILTYKRALAYLKEHQPKLTFEMIDDVLLTKHQTYLIKKKGLEMNGALPHFKNGLFVFLNWATKNGINTNLKYKDFKLTETEKHHNVYLTMEEIQKIKNLEDLPSYLENTKNWLILMCFTGLRVSDALRLNETNIFLKEKQIALIMQKTNRTVRIPILPLAEPYIAKFLNGEIHKISSQKLNTYYKILGKLADIDTPTTYTNYTPIRQEKTLPKYELITNHCFRRSFATMSLTIGIQPSIIMKITGHRTLSSFEKYIGYTAQNAMDEMQRAWSGVKF